MQSPQPLSRVLCSCGTHALRLLFRCHHIQQTSQLPAPKPETYTSHPLARQAGDLRSMYAGTRHAGLGPEVKRRVLMGTYALSAGYYDAYYKRAQQVRAAVA